MLNILSKNKNRQKYLILIFFGIVLVTLGVLGKNFLPKSEITEITAGFSLKPTKIEINFDLFQNPILKELQPVEEIKPFEEKVGRDNPFLPY